MYITKVMSIFIIDTLFVIFVQYKKIFSKNIKKKRSISNIQVKNEGLFLQIYIYFFFIFNSLFIYCMNKEIYYIITYKL